MNWTILHTVYDDVSLLNFKEAASLALVNTPLLVSVQDLRRGSTAREGKSDSWVSETTGRLQF